MSTYGGSPYGGSRYVGGAQSGREHFEFAMVTPSPTGYDAFGVLTFNSINRPGTPTISVSNIRPTLVDLMSSAFVEAGSSVGQLVYAFRRGAIHLLDSTGKVQQWRSGDGFETIADDTTIADGAGDDDRNVAGGRVPSTGTLLFFYARLTGATFVWEDLRLLRSTDGGDTYTDTGSIAHGSDTRYNPYGPLVELPSGRLMQTFYGFDGTNYRIYVLFSDDDGQTWGDETTVATSTTIQYTEAACIYVSGASDAVANLLMVTRVDNGVMRQLTSTDGGQTWSDDGTLSLSSGTGTDVSPWLLLRGTTAHLIFARRNASPPRYLLYTTGDAADLMSSGPGEWAATESFWTSTASTPGDFGYPSMVDFDGMEHVMFYDLSDAPSGRVSLVYGKRPL